MNEFDELAAYLKKSIDFDEEDLKIILSYFKIVKKNKNEILLAHGKVSEFSYFVKKGCLRIYFINDEGKDSTRYIAFENQFATALVSFITKEPAEEINNSKRLISFTTLSAAERYDQLFKINPNIVKRLPNKIVASYINVSNETLSRLKSKI